METVALGPFKFDRDLATLQRDGQSVGLSRPGSALLATMLEANGAVVGRNALMEAAWPGTIVEDANLTVQIAALRKALGSCGEGGEWIVTVPRVGYRLVRPSVEPTPGQPVIAVMPFTNLSSDPEQGFFADGLTDDLVTALSRFKTFAVVGRNSTAAHSEPGADVRETAAALGVRYVLQGSVRRAGANVRVSAQLIDGESSAHLWAEHFEGTGADLFDFQDNITERVIGLTAPQIRRAEIERARRKRPESLDAWGLYVKALPLVQAGRVADYDEAITLLERAVVLDPNYAPALALAAWAHEKRFTFGGVPPPGVDDAKECLGLAARALEAGSDDAEVLAIVGWMHLVFNRDWELMSEFISRAVELNPNNVSVLNWAGQAKLQYGSPEEAMPILHRALKLSPGAPENAQSQITLAWACFLLHRFEDAVAWAERSLHGHKHSKSSGLIIIGAASVHLDRMECARDAISEFLAMHHVTLDLWRHSPMRREQDRMMIIESLRKAGLPEH